MTTIREMYGMRKRAGHIGLEVEVEFTRGALAVASPGGPWLVKRDGSLINGIEYYLRQPIKADGRKRDKIKLLTDVLDPLVADGRVVEDSPRTSCHVHCNVQDLTPLQVWTVAVAAFLLENPLTTYCGKYSRVANRYCLRVKDNTKIINQFIDDVDSQRPFQGLCERGIKYSAVNLGHVANYGSIEFRGMRGHYELDHLDSWTSALWNLVQAAASFPSPEAVYDFFFEADKADFLRKFLTPNLVAEIEKQDGWEAAIRRAAYDVYPLATCTNWEKWEARVNKNNPSLLTPSTSIEEEADEDVPNPLAPRSPSTSMSSSTTETNMSTTTNQSTTSPQTYQSPFSPASNQRANRFARQMPLSDYYRALGDVDRTVDPPVFVDAVTETPINISQRDAIFEEVPISWRDERQWFYSSTTVPTTTGSTNGSSGSSSTGG